MANRSRGPSLGAKYLGVVKSCQEEMSEEPQNLWLALANMSTGSGGDAGERKDVCEYLRGAKKAWRARVLLGATAPASRRFRTRQVPLREQKRN